MDKGVTVTVPSAVAGLLVAPGVDDGNDVGVGVSVGRFVGVLVGAGVAVGVGEKVAVAVSVGEGKMTTSSPVGEGKGVVMATAGGRVDGGSQAATPTR